MGNTRVLCLGSLLAWSMLTATFAGAQNAASDRETADKIDAYMKAAEKFTRFSGSILVARKGIPIITRSYGMANWEWELPNRPSTVFRLGSTTKAITATAIMMLQEKGKLKLDDPVCTYFEDCPATWQPILIRHLLNHSSGLVDYTSINEFRQKQTIPFTHKELMGLFKDLPLQFPPGTQAQYGNSGYLLAGMIIEKVSGNTYEGFLKEHIFAPLGMGSTSYDSSRRLVKNRASGYVLQDGALVNAYYIDMMNPYAAGGLMSTVEDLFRFSQALHGGKLMSKASLREMFTPHLGGYALGWDILQEFNRNKIEKGGIVPNGFSANLSYFPDEGVTIIFLGNNFSTHVRRAAIDATAIVFGEPYALPRERKAVRLSPQVLQQYTGRFQQGQGAPIIVTLEAGRLMWQRGVQPKFELLPEGENLFFRRDAQETYTFPKDGNGAVIGVEMESSGRVVRAKKVN